MPKTPKNDGYCGYYTMQKPKPKRAKRLCRVKKVKTNLCQDVK